MTLQNHHKLETPKVRQRVMSLLLGGATPSEVAIALSTPTNRVTHQAVYAFRARHKDKLEAAMGAAEVKAMVPAITEKANRIAEYAWIYDELRKVQDEHGFAPDGRFSGRLSAEMRATLDAVAEELGQKPRADINIDNRIQLLVRTIGGANVEEIV